MHLKSADGTRPGYLFVLSWFPASLIGGVNQSVLHLARMMKEGGRYSPLLLVSNGHPLPADTAHVAGPVFSLAVRDPLVAPLGYWFWLPRTLFRLRKLIARHNVQVINCTVPEAECLTFALRRRLALFHGQLWFVLQGNDIKMAMEKTGFGRRLVQYMLRHADRVVACSQGIQNDLLRLEPRCSANSVVIHNSIDIQGFAQQDPHGYQLPERLRQSPFLLNIGRFEHKKGQDVLVKAFRRIAARFPDLLLVMVGASVGAESEPVHQLVRDSGLQDRILVFENVPHEHIPVFLRATRVFVLPSRREGFPFALLEAGALKAPSVAAACVGVPELIEDGVTGRLVAVEDDGGLAEAISDLLLDEAESRRLGANLYRRVSEGFTWKQAYEKYLRL